MAAAVTADAVIYLPGIMGSELRIGQKVVWGAKLGRILRQVFFRDVFEQLEPKPDDGIVAGNPISFPAMIPLLGSMEPYADLGKRLKGAVLRPEAVLAFGYDWRHPVGDAAAALAPIAKTHLTEWRARYDTIDRDERRGLGQPMLTLVGHSMGGLVAASYLANADADVAAQVRRVITLGTPFQGSLNALRVIATGEQLPFGLWSESLQRSAVKMPGLYDLLARYPSVEEPGSDLPRVLTPADVGSIGGSVDLALQAFDRMDGLMEQVATFSNRTLHCLSGTTQPTLQSVSIEHGIPTFGEEVTHADGYRADFGGDGTVYRYASTPTHIDGHPLPQSHGALAKTGEGTNYAAEIATLRRPGPYQGDGDLGLRIADVVQAGRPFDATVTAGSERPVTWRVQDAELGTVRMTRKSAVRDGEATISLTIPAAGLHRVTVAAGGFSAVERLVLAVESS